MTMFRTNRDNKVHNFPSFSSVYKGSLAGLAECHKDFTFSIIKVYDENRKVYSYDHDAGQVAVSYDSYDRMVVLEYMEKTTRIKQIQVEQGWHAVRTCEYLEDDRLMEVILSKKDQEEMDKSSHPNLELESNLFAPYHLSWLTAAELKLAGYTAIG